MDDNEYDASEFKHVYGAKNADSKKRPQGQAPKKGWGDDDDERTVDFLEKHNAQVAEQQAVTEAEKQKKDEVDAKRNLNLAKYKGSALASAKMPTKLSDLPQAPAFKLTNHATEDAGSKFKKAPGTATVNVPVAEDKNGTPEKGEVKIMKKDQKVRLGGEDEQRFLEEKRLAQERLEALEREAEAERAAKEEAKKNKQGNLIQKGAEKFKPQKKEEASKPAEVSTNASDPAPKVDKKPAVAEKKPAPGLWKPKQTVAPAPAPAPVAAVPAPTPEAAKKKARRWSDDE